MKRNGITRATAVIALLLLILAIAAAAQNKPLAPEQQKALAKAEAAADQIFARMRETRDFAPLWDEFYSADAIGFARHENYLSTSQHGPGVTEKLAAEIPDSTIRRKLAAETTLYYLLAAIYMANLSPEEVQKAANGNGTPPMQADVLNVAAKTQFYSHFFDNGYAGGSVSEPHGTVISSADDLENYITETEEINAAMRQHVPVNWDQQEPGRTNLQWFRKNQEEPPWTAVIDGKNESYVPRFGLLFIFVEEKGQPKLWSVAYNN